MHVLSRRATCLAASEGTQYMSARILPLGFHPDILKAKKSHREHCNLCSRATRRKEWGGKKSLDDVLQFLFLILTYIGVCENIKQKKNQLSAFFFFFKRNLLKCQIIVCLEEFRDRWQCSSNTTSYNI